MQIAMLDDRRDIPHLTDCDRDVPQCIKSCLLVESQLRVVTGLGDQSRWRFEVNFVRAEKQFGSLNVHLTACLQYTECCARTTEGILNVYQREQDITVSRQIFNVEDQLVIIISQLRRERVVMPVPSLWNSPSLAALSSRESLK